MRKLVLAGLIVPWLWGCAVSPSESPSSPQLITDPAEPPGVKATVQYVYDGDTIEVVLPEGVVARVRYLGVDTPELEGLQCFSQEARERNRSLVEGKLVYLEEDVEPRDRYGRLLRYVWLANHQMVNRLLLAEGYGRALSIPPNTRYAEEFRRLEEEARKAQRGLWGHCPP